MTDSHNLLAEYRQNGSDAAFRELVARFVDLVYSTALRLVEGDTHWAEDVAQTVFVNLARKARTLPEDVRLGGWLHRDACLVAGHIMRDERRRRSRERLAVEMNGLQNHSEADFSQVAPILDEAINELSEADRTAILLRFFEQQDFRLVGQALGSSEDAARMRVTRALEKLEDFLKRRGVTTSAASLGVVLSANAVKAAPVGLAFTISTAAALAGTSIAATGTATAVKTIAMTTLQKTLITAAIAAAIGTGIYEARQAAQLREQNQGLARRQAPLAEQNEQLTRERDDATRRLAALRDDSERMNRNNAELLKLRGEVGMLRRELADKKHLVGSSNDLATTWTIGQTKWSQDWKNAGLSSPEAAFETFRWAAANTNFQTMRQCLIFDYGTNTESPSELFANRKVRSELIQISQGMTGGIRLYAVRQESDDRAAIEIEKMLRRGVNAVRPGINGTENHYYKLSDPPEWDLRKDTVNLLKVDGEWKVIEDAPSRVTLTPGDEDSNAVAEMMMKMGPNELEEIKTKVPSRTLRAYEALKAKGSP